VRWPEVASSASGGGILFARRLPCPTGRSTNCLPSTGRVDGPGRSGANTRHGTGPAERLAELVTQSQETLARAHFTRPAPAGSVAKLCVRLVRPAPPWVRVIEQGIMEVGPPIALGWPHLPAGAVHPAVRVACSTAPRGGGSPGPTKQPLSTPPSAGDRAEFRRYGLHGSHHICAPGQASVDLRSLTRKRSVKIDHGVVYKVISGSDQARPSP